MCYGNAKRMFRVRIGGEPNPPLTQTLINDSAQKALSKSIYLCFRRGSGGQKFLVFICSCCGLPRGLACDRLRNDLSYVTREIGERRLFAGSPGAKGQSPGARRASRFIGGDGVAGHEPVACGEVDSPSYAGSRARGRARIELPAKCHGPYAAPAAQL